jgi:hypothetical protein
LLSINFIHDFNAFIISKDKTGGALIESDATTAKIRFGANFKNVATGSAISDGREPESCLGRVFDAKLGRIGKYCKVSVRHTYGIF